MRRLGHKLSCLADAANERTLVAFRVLAERERRGVEESSRVMEMTREPRSHTGGTAQDTGAGPLLADRRGSYSRVAPVYLRPLLAEARRRGIELGELFRGLPFSATDLDQPAFTISHLEAVTVVRRAVQLFPNPALGLELGKRSRITDRGVLALALLSSPDLAAAMALPVRFPASAGFLLGVRELRERKQHVLVAESLFESHDVAAFLVDKLFAGLIRQWRQISETECSPKRVELMRAPPVNATAYEAYYRCPVKFNGLSNRLCIDEAWLRTPLPTASAMSYQLACTLLEREAEQLFGPSSLRQAIAQAIRMTLPAVPAPAQIASMLHLSARSLRRKLAQQNLSYRTLLDEVRRDRALDLVLNGRRSMAEAAAETGFGDPRSFRRAFSRWTGQTPSSMRASQEAAETLRHLDAA